MAEVVALLPHGITCCEVELKTGGTFGKTAVRQSYVSFEYQRVGTAFFLRESAECQRASDVGGAACVLSAGIEEEKAFLAQGNIGVQFGFVVNDGPVCAIGGYGGKAWLFEARTLRAELCKCLFCFYFSNFLDLHRCFQPS